MPMGRGIEVLWFDRRAVSVGDKCQAGFLTSELPSLLNTDTDNAHTDNATKSHLTAEITAGRPEKRGARARCAQSHEQVRQRIIRSSSRASRRYAARRKRCANRNARALCPRSCRVSVWRLLCKCRDDGRGPVMRMHKCRDYSASSHSPKSLRGPEFAFARQLTPCSRFAAPSSRSP